MFNDGQGIECYNLVGNKREGQGVHMYTRAHTHTHTHTYTEASSFDLEMDLCVVLFVCQDRVHCN